MALQTPNINALIAKLENPRAFLLDVARILQESTVRRITTTKTSPDGVPWQQWAASTASARARRGSSAGGLLYDSGNLARSITSQVQGNQAVVGSKGVGYAKFLQIGTRKMPARPFIGISNDDQTRIHASLVSYLKGTK